MEIRKTMEPSPSTPVATAGIERRVAPRANAQFEVRYGSSGEEPHVAKVCDISATGVGLMGPKQYPVDAEIELRFRAPAGTKGDLLMMKAKVRHSTGMRMGLEFVNVPTSDHLRVRDMINRLIGAQQK
jgi:c-di-GMP-binding flagellar brake protein YcgR